MPADPNPFTFDLYPQALIILFVNCNYHCHYCIGGIEHSTPDLGPMATADGRRALVRFFDNHGRWHVILDGGEPSITPGFYELLGDLGRNHVVTLHTNLAFDVGRFAAAIPPEATGWLMCSLHPEGERDIDGYFDRVRALKESGYRTVIRYVADPRRLSRIDTYIARCRSLGVGFLPAAMYYDKRGKRYPRDYTAEQRRFLRGRMPLAGHVAQLELDLLASYDWPCRAGRDAFFIDGASGDIHRCVSNRHRLLGNVFQNSLDPAADNRPCDVNICGCDLYFFLGYPEGLGEIDRFARVLDGRSDPAPPEEQEKFLEAARRIDAHGRARSAAAMEKQARYALSQRLQKVRTALAGGRLGLYGAGSHTRYLLDLLGPDLQRPVAIIDSDPAKWGAQIDSLRVDPPEAIGRLDLDGILISSASYESEIYRKLRRLLPKGFPIHRIYHD